MFSKGRTKHFKGLGNGFTKLHAKLNASHQRQNEAQIRKSACVKAVQFTA
jgi:hypothetical protein